MDDLGTPLFEETSIWGYGYFMMRWSVFRVIEWGVAIVFLGQATEKHAMLSPSW